MLARYPKDFSSPVVLNQCILLADTVNATQLLLTFAISRMPHEHDKHIF